MQTYVYDGGVYRLYAPEMLKGAIKRYMLDLSKREGWGEYIVTKTQLRLSHTLCKPRVWCIIGTPHWRI